MKNLIINIASLFLDLKKLNRISKLLKMSPRKIYESFLHEPKKFAQKLNLMSPSQRRVFSEALGSALTKETETQNLSSSWIKKGKWEPTGTGTVGDLTIWTIKGKIGYTYPGVEYKIWVSMKNAKGKNGGGAGSVFWALYLRRFKKSSFGQFLKKVQKLSGIKGLKLK